MNRVKSLDSAKGLFVVLMTISHIGLGGIPYMVRVNHDWLLLFKMPGFYIISGYLMYNAVQKPGFMIKKMDGIYKPYVSMVFLLCLLFFVTGSYISLENICNLLLGFNYSIGNTDFNIYPSWFVVNLPVSFLFCQLIVYGYARGNYVISLSVIVFLVVLNNLNHLSSIKLPFHADLSIYAVLYMMTGFFMREKSFDFNKKSNIFIFGFLYLSLRSIFPNEIIYLDVAQKNYANFFATYITSTSGVIFVISILSLLNDKSLITKFLAYCSQNSLFILVFHIPVWIMVERFLVSDGSILSIIFFNLLTIFICLIIGVSLKKIDSNGRLFKVRTPPPQALKVGITYSTKNN